MGPFVRFNVALLLFSLMLLSAGAVALRMLDGAGRLPPPPLTATNCIDEKFKFLHETEVRDPDLIAVGSSVTWRNIDLSVLDKRYGARVRAINGAPCYLKVHETAFLTRFYIDHIPSVRVVLSIFAMRDFNRCTGDGKFFDVQAARRYIIERKPAWHLYFTNFRPIPFLRDVVQLPAMRSGADRMKPLNMDEYGSGPLLITPPDTRSDMATTPDCFDRLTRLAWELRQRKVQWVVVLLPPMPAWLAKYDPDRSRDRAWREAVQQHLKDTAAVVIDGRHGPSMSNANFTDPAHLHWTSVPAFTRWITEELARQSVLAPAPERVADAF